MSERHALRLHHPVDHRAAGLAGAEAVPEVLLRTDDERRRLVVVERAAADPIGTVGFKLDAGALDEPNDGYLFLQPLEVRRRDPRPFRSFQKTCQAPGAYFFTSRVQFQFGSDNIVIAYITQQADAMPEPVIAEPALTLPASHPWLGEM